MIKHTIISRLDGLILTASVDDGQEDAEFSEVKGKVKLVQRRLNRNSEPQASIESGSYTYHYLISGDLCFLCICDRSYPRKLAFTYLSDLSQEFTTIYQPQQFLSPTCRPYAFVEFDTFIQRTKKTYQDSRATQNLDKLNDELKDVTKVMTKNIEDLLYRGDSLERMGDISSRLREDSRKYKKAAVRINWELLLKQYGPIGGLAFIVETRDLRPASSADCAIDILGQRCRRDFNKEFGQCHGADNDIICLIGSLHHVSPTYKSKVWTPALNSPSILRLLLDMTMPKPHVVLLHGAWHSPIYFAKITALLQDHLYVVHAQQLPSVGVPPSWTPPSDLSQDTAAARSLVDRAIADGNDVVVICHSWGGTIASNALVGYSKKERAEKGLKGGVVKVGYMCAFMIDEGQSLESGEPPSWSEVNGPYLIAKDPKAFYSDLPESEQAYWFSQLQAHSRATCITPLTGASWKTIPSSYLLCEQDNAIPAAFQEIMANAAREKGAHVDIVRLDCGHSPFLSKPKETLSWIMGVAGEEVSATH
ncbi:hypothetical protein OPT61_g3256 [Boeremia exigua]|uniref:Uncharacterized protein n=1 Tax=Boeremia exigua TaxID=749465 RepID=A0ACC2IIK2_9PLEO|nr:hypothetical protein OPT61_g3256 [Boeremia exigua]